jgi:hypothetical protein
MEYAVKKGVSLSTLRRHIKANKVLYKVENGRYLLHDPDAAQEESQAPALRAYPVPKAAAGKDEAARRSSGNASSAQQSAADAAPAQLQARVQKLEKELQRAREENAELKTLIAYYEEQMSTTSRRIHS